MNLYVAQIHSDLWLLFPLDFHVDEIFLEQEH